MAQLFCGFAVLGCGPALAAQTSQQEQAVASFFEVQVHARCNDGHATISPLRSSDEADFRVCDGQGPKRRCAQVDLQSVRYGASEEIFLKFSKKAPEFELGLARGAYAELEKGCSMLNGGGGGIGLADHFAITLKPDVRAEVRFEKTVCSRQGYPGDQNRWVATHSYVLTLSRPGTPPGVLSAGGGSGSGLFHTEQECLAGAGSPIWP